jgi:4-hydroxy-3-methylbut-2-en-1-yl diphosphate synthase IspG/GcpE
VCFICNVLFTSSSLTLHTSLHSTVTVGPIKIGSEFPVQKQTMCTTNTKDVEASVEQIVKIHKEGAGLARLTVQGRFEADACMKIREALWERNIDIPLVADIHFAPAVAMRVADAFEKVRINPGNFADGIKSFEDKVYDSREEYDKDIPAIEVGTSTNPFGSLSLLSNSFFLSFFLVNEYNFPSMG